MYKIHKNSPNIAEVKHICVRNSKEEPQSERKYLQITFLTKYPYLEYVKNFQD